MAKVLILAIIGAALIVQLALQSEPILVALCGLALLIGLLPALVLGPDLYTIFAALFATRYVGIALITKTWLLQPLDLHLHAPEAAYGLSCLLMIVVIGTILTVRATDRGATWFTVPQNPETLRLMGSVGFTIGALAYLGSGVLISREADAPAATGPGVALIILGGIHLLGFIAEVRYCALASRNLFSFRIILMLAVMFAISMFLNSRSVMFDGVIAIAISGIIYRVIRARHLVGLAVAAVLASQIINPITFELRRIKEGKSAAEFAGAAAEVVTKAFSDPDFLATLQVRQAQEAQVDNPLNLYDYYGDPTNVMNRFSFVALVDAIYFRAERQVPLGLSALDEIYSRIVPGFLVEKEAKPYGYGDWLAWELGIFPPPLKTHTNFGIPMEGYAVAGMLGFILFPIALLGPVLFILGRVSSLRAQYPASLLLFGAVQWPIVEGTSDILFVVLTRQIPILVMGLLITQFLVHRLTQATLPLPIAFLGRRVHEFGRRAMPMMSRRGLAP